MSTVLGEFHTIHDIDKVTLQTPQLTQESNNLFKPSKGVGLIYLTVSDPQRHEDLPPWWLNISVSLRC